MLLCYAQRCTYKAPEECFGNMHSNFSQFPHVNYGTCSFCRKDTHRLLCLNRAEVTIVFFNISNLLVGDSRSKYVEGEMWNLDNLINAIRKYPLDGQNMSYLLVKSCAKSAVSPDLIKKTC